MHTEVSAPKRFAKSLLQNRGKLSGDLLKRSPYNSRLPWLLITEIWLPHAEETSPLPSGE